MSFLYGVHINADKVTKLFALVLILYVRAWWWMASCVNFGSKYNKNNYTNTFSNSSHKSGISNHRSSSSSSSPKSIPKFAYYFQCMRMRSMRQMTKPGAAGASMCFNLIDIKSHIHTYSLLSMHVIYEWHDKDMSNIHPNYLFPNFRSFYYTIMRDENLRMYTHGASSSSATETQNR